MRNYGIERHTVQLKLFKSAKIAVGKSHSFKQFLKYKPELDSITTTNGCLNFLTDLVFLIKLSFTF